MEKVIKKIISDGVLFKSDIAYEIRNGYQNMWVENHEEVADTIIRHLQYNGYVITKKDEASDVYQV